MRRIISAVLLTALAASIVPDVAAADEQRLLVAEQNPIQKSLEAAVGKSVTLKLGAGEEISGIVAKVGPEAVQLTQLQGKEFFDALVPFAKISALVVRAKS